MEVLLKDDFYFSSIVFIPMEFLKIKIVQKNCTFKETCKNNTYKKFLWRELEPFSGKFKRKRNTTRYSNTEFILIIA